MGGKSSSGPKAPDPWTQAQAQLWAGKEAMRQGALYNQMGINSPWGQQYYTGAVGSPERTLNIELSPEAERARALQSQLTSALGGYALGELGPAMMERLRAPPGQAGEEIYQRGLARLEPEFERSETERQSQLLGQGIPVGSRAYAQEMDRMDRRQAEALENLELSSQIAGREEDRLARSQSINELIATLGAAPEIGSPATMMPGQQGMTPPNIGGYMQQNYGNELARWQQQQQNRAGLYGLGGTALAFGPDIIKGWKGLF